MKILRTRNEVSSFRQILLLDKISIGFVPTMGALHQGHLELIKVAKENSEAVFVSIFVNPIQFNNPEDFAKYPNTIEKDLALLESVGVDAVFIPDIQEVYPEETMMRLDFGYLESVLEGAFRPGHFNGVGIVVAKLLNIVKPKKAFFGQKDLQQVAVIKRLVMDLSFDTEVVVVPTVREKDGLALSSRNLRLSIEERLQALMLFRTLSQAKADLLNGKDWSHIKEEVKKEYSMVPNTKLEYFELVHAESFRIISGFEETIPLSICVAAYIGDVRLIDNISVNH